MCRGRTVLLLLLIFLFPALGFADAGNTEEDLDPEPPADGFAVSIDFRTGCNVISIIPGIPAVIGVPMSVSSNSVTIIPQFGFLYYFDVMTDLHNPFYIPIGAGVFYNPLNLGGDLTYYVPVAGTNNNHMLSTAVATEVELFSTGRFSLLFELKFGPMFVFEPDETIVQVMVNGVLIPRFKL